MSKPPIKRGGPRKPVRSDARGASSRPSRPRRDDASEPVRDGAPRKRFARSEGDPGDAAPWRAPRGAGGAAERPARAAAGSKPRGAGAAKGKFAGKVAGDGARSSRPPRAGKEGGFAPRPRKPRDDGAFARRERPAPAPQTAPDPDKPLREGDRIAKVMARAGLCSRRDAEIWIAEGRVAVNGRVLDTANVVVGDNDRITVDGHPLAKRERTRLFLFNKPRGLVTTDRDPEGRPTIFAAMPADLPRLVTIGRLDINTEGLLLLTNDGGLARVLELPSTGWLRRYRVRAHGETDQARLDALRMGVSIDGVDYAGVEASLDRVQGGNVWLTMGLREGKNREVKRILEHLGLSVNRLIRVSYGPFHLGDLPEGAVEEVRSRHLRDQLGPQLAAEAGVDFDSPLVERDEREERVEPRRRIAWRADEPEAEAPRKKKPAPPKRAHVSALRAERAAETERMRSERSQTEDRHGRVVAVERRMRATPEPEAPKPRKGPPKIAGERRAEGGRDVKRGPRDAGRPATGRAREDGPTRGERPYGAAARGPRPEGGARFGAGKPGFTTARREDRDAGGASERPARAARGAGERSFQPRAEGERPARFARDGDARPARAPRGEGKSFAKPFAKGPRREGGFGQESERPARSGPPRGKAFVAKPSGEKPRGASFGGKPGGRPAGGKSFGGKPSGGRPSGGKPGGRGPSQGGRPSGGPGRGPKRG